MLSLILIKFKTVDVVKRQCVLKHSGLFMYRTPRLLFRLSVDVCSESRILCLVVLEADSLV
jgi:hypothetical protein